MVTVEFFGIPRERAGRTMLTVPAGTVAEVLAAVEKACPKLAGLRQADGRLAPHYALSIHGQRFVNDMNERVAAGESVYLLSADVGG